MFFEEFFLGLVLVRKVGFCPISWCKCLEGFLNVIMLFETLNHILQFRLSGCLDGPKPGRHPFKCSTRIFSASVTISITVLNIYKYSIFISIAYLRIQCIMNYNMNHTCLMCVLSSQNNTNNCQVTLRINPSIYFLSKATWPTTTRPDEDRAPWVVLVTPCESQTHRPGVHLVCLKAQVRVQDQACAHVIIFTQLLGCHSRGWDMPTLNVHRCISIPCYQKNQHVVTRSLRLW